MPVLKNSRHEAFSQALAKGASETDAYRKAGYKVKGDSIWTAASRLYRNVQVKRRVAELKKHAAERTVETVESIARQLDDDRSFARKVKQAGAAVTATVAKAKVLNLMPDRHELTGRNGGPIEYRAMSPAERRKRIDELVAKRGG